MVANPHPVCQGWISSGSAAVVENLLSIGRRAKHWHLFRNGLGIVKIEAHSGILGDIWAHTAFSMQPPRTKSGSAAALVGIWNVLLTAFVIAILYFARDMLIPLALAALLTFLLAPLVTRLERWMGRIAAVLLVVTMIFSMIGMAGWVLTRQLVDLATRLPDYKVNIETKLHSFQLPSGGAFKRLSETVEEVKKDFRGSDAPIVSQVPGKPETAVAVPVSAAPTLPVQVVETSKANPLQLLQVIISPLLGPLGTTGLVILLVIFMLLKREDLRSRLIRLIGQGRISATTHALDDANHRVSRYLLMQLVVNVTFGIAVAIGLFFIGVPNAILLGSFATVLRFIPYIGAWIAAAFPIILSFAISPSWMMPLLTLGLFVLLELICSNIVEPWLYGSSTGVSSIALVVAAVFWTWLWGPIGLMLATPLTVCLVVMGRHVPQLAFLSIMLSDEDALTPAEQCYHRLLTVGLNEASELADAYVKANSLTALYDAVLIPVITAAETDHQRGSLDNEQRDFVEQGIRDIIEDLGTGPALESRLFEDKREIEHSPPPAPARACRICCLPARANRDEIAGTMVVHLLQQQGFQAQNAPAKLVAGELVKMVDEADVDAACISVVAPSTVIHARYLCAKLRAQLPNLKIVVGLWGATENIIQAAQRLRDSGASEVVTTLADAVVQLATLAPPADKDPGLSALAELKPLDSDTESVPESQFFKSPTGTARRPDRHA
jgi:predicted PurR-regulated permease PerM/methylmalonyl-CoA mutase cobalamin-binding subunit